MITVLIVPKITVVDFPEITVFLFPVYNSPFNSMWGAFPTRRSHNGITEWFQWLPFLLQ